MTESRYYSPQRAVTVTHPFCYAHRLMHHRGKCRYIHGHNGVAVVTVAATGGLTAGDMVIDFADLKKIVCGWVDANWDHNILLHEKDPLAVLAEVPNLCIHDSKDVFARDVFAGRSPFITGQHPTAETMAEILFHQATRLLGHYPVRVLSTTIHETEKCSASFAKQEVRP